MENANEILNVIWKLCVTLYILIQSFTIKNIVKDMGNNNKLWALMRQKFDLEEEMYDNLGNMLCDLNNRLKKLEKKQK